jgi:SPP1 family predicted phage head-tail adaptor
MNLSGGLRHRIDIQSRTDVQDETTGEVVPTWSMLYASVPAKIEPLSVREFMAAQAVQSGITARITIRYKAGLTANMRILHGATIYNPAGFLPDLESGLEYLTIPCSAGVNEG